MTRKLIVVGCMDVSVHDSRLDCPMQHEGMGAYWCALDTDPKNHERDTPQDGTAPEWCPLRKGAFTLELQS